MAEIINDQESGFEAVEYGGEKFLLACLPTPKLVRMAFPTAEQAAPVFPRSDLRPIDRRVVCGDTWILNQRSKGSCVGWSSVGAMMRCRALAGGEFVRLSGSFVYSFINGGRDRGASIGDSLDALREYGACLESECPWDSIYPRDIPAAAYETAKRFRLDEAYRIETYDEALSGIALGFTLVFAVHVGGSFSSLDSEDVVGLDRGSGNHAVAADGLYQSHSRGWMLDCFNSWDLTWGNRGRFRITERHWDSVVQDAYLMRSVAIDPQGPQPPVPHE